MSRSYAAFGEPGAGAATSGYAFAGREWDPETGLYYYRARYYDPASAVFLSADPAGLRADVNLYRYVYNNPARFSDPSGLEGVDLCFRQMKGMDSSIRVPHPVVRPHGKGCIGTGFGPASHSKKTMAKVLTGAFVEGLVEDENVCDANGNISPQYSCSTQSSSPCVEACVTLLIEAEKPPNSPPYKIGKPENGAFQCNDWANAVVTVCSRDCARSGKP